MDPRSIPLDSLLLDPNNYRLQESEGFTIYPENRFHIDRVQEATSKRLRAESLDPLKNSILSNGFLEIERIVVSPYPHEEEKFLVIEGNRRVAALMLIRNDYDAGVVIPEQVVATFSAVPCIVIPSDGQNSYLREAIMGIRHVGGIKEWGGFQRAKLVADMKDIHGLDAGEISDRIGLSAIEVNRRYRAYKALQQMQDSEEYGDYATPPLYPLFHEAVSIPAIRSWLHWNPDHNKFEDQENTERFYQLISPRKLDDGNERPAKLKTYSDIRSIRDIVGNQDALADLLQPERELVDALTIVNRKRIAGKWKNEVSEARTALQNIPALEVSLFESHDILLIRELIETAQKVLDIRYAVSK